MSEKPASITLSGDASEQEILQALRSAGIGDLDDLVREHVSSVQAHMRSTGPVNDIIIVYATGKHFCVLPS